MPYIIRKLPNQNKYLVMNKLTGKIFAKHSTYFNAKAQIRFLESIKR